MNEELRGTIKTLQDIPLVKSGSYEFIGDSNITYADIYILLEFIRNQEQENQKYKKVIEKANKWVRDYMDEWDMNDEVWHDLNDLLILLEEVEHGED